MSDAIEYAINRCIDGDYGVTRGAEKLGVTEAEFVEKMETAGYKIPTFV